MLYHQGQGANSAILDARELGRALGSASSVKEALAAYVQVRKPIAQELQRISRQSWDAGAVDDVFPGQHEGQAASTLEK
jgi:salicylate hydroxylase